MPTNNAVLKNYLNCGSTRATIGNTRVLLLSLTEPGQKQFITPLIRAGLFGDGFNE
jgi:hypothetical protein